MSIPVRLIKSLTTLAPLVSSTAALICSLSQQITMTSFLHPSIPARSLHSLFGAWQTRFKKIVFLSAPAHLLTLIFCALNLRNRREASSANPTTGTATSSSSTLTPWLWSAAAIFTLLHAYPARRGMRFVLLDEDGWKSRSPQQGLLLLRDFVQINGKRLLLVDLPGWLCVLAAVVMSHGCGC